MNKLSKPQKITLLILFIFSVAYFWLFIPVNSSSSEGGSVFSIFSNDEYITYPYVEKMLRGGKDIHELWGNLIIYGDYHYGYPFYFLSTLVLLPRRILLGDAFFAARTTNILLLRQMINVLPMIAAAWILVYYKTHYRKVFQSIFLFLFFLIVPSVVRSNIWWWHPDSLTFLFIALTFLFLQKDGYQLGKNFFLAAAMCGLAAATKLLGFFFFLTIPVYLLMARSKLGVAWKKIVQKALLFVCVMAAVIVLVNPFLWYETPRNEMIAIQQFKQIEIKEGYTNGDPETYQKGPVYWKWTLENWFGSPVFLCFLIVSVIVGCFHRNDFQENLYLATWSFPFLLYALFFVAPKPDHYLLPLLIPLYSAGFDLITPLTEWWKKGKSWQRGLAILGLLLIAYFLLGQFSYQIPKSLTQLSAYFGA